jgi:hypothetical protein
MKNVEKLLLWFLMVCNVIGSLYIGISFFKDRVIETERKTQSEIVLVNKINDLSSQYAVSQKEIVKLSKRLTASDSTQVVILKQQKVDKSTLKTHLKLSEKQDEYIKYLEGLIE